MRRTQSAIQLFVGLLVCVEFASPAFCQLSEEDQHSIRWHRPEQLTMARRIPGFVPVTVASKDAASNERLLPLDEAIRIALNHAEVLRVLTGTTAASSRQTIYDTAIASSAIDQAVAAFDPVFSANSNWRKSETAGTRLDPADPLGLLGASRLNAGNSFSAELVRRNRMGGDAKIEFGNEWSYTDSRGPGQLTRQNSPSLGLSYTQPLLSGAGVAFNEAPIVIARIQQDRSYFQFKDSTQDLIEGIISAYWSLVGARTELWAREKQVEQAKESLDQVRAKFKFDLADIGEVAQPRVALANFKAQLIRARGDVIQREAALRNLLGLPPEDGSRLVPSTPPTRERLQFDWLEMVQTAQQFRPDLIELHLIQQADRQRLIQADNGAQPTLNAVATQSWNGITGRALNGRTVSSELNDNPNWSLGLNFSVPLSLRASRAAVRSSELQLAKDRANIQQGLHATEHSLATTMRNIDQFYEQYQAFQETRAAALINLQVQLGERRAGRAIFLDVLQAITAWGDAVSSEASSLTQYNAALATLEKETGTILETHNITFAEEQYMSIGAWGKHFQGDCYPKSLKPQRNSSRYEDGMEPSEEAFDLQDIDQQDIRDRIGETKPVSASKVLLDNEGDRKAGGSSSNSFKSNVNDRKSFGNRLRNLFRRSR